MNYQALTVRKAIDRLNRNYFLPSLQREFVWTDKQIIRLFDSVMRGYPRVKQMQPEICRIPPAPAS
jgi:uncharacterized protein with ParB-like and HNH nuclease domain